MPNGAGQSPAGRAAAGYGLPTPAQLPSTAPLPDATTMIPQTGRFIDPVTGDYQFTADGRIVGMGTVPQLVLLALETQRGSSCQADLGQTFTQIREKGQNFRKQASAAITAALGPLIRKNLVQVNSITVIEPQGNPDAGVVQLTWTDLTSGIQQPTIPVGSQ